MFSGLCLLTRFQDVTCFIFYFIKLTCYRQISSTNYSLVSHTMRNDFRSMDCIHSDRVTFLKRDHFDADRQRYSRHALHESDCALRGTCNTYLIEHGRWQIKARCKCSCKYINENRVICFSFVRSQEVALYWRLTLKAVASRTSYLWIYFSIPSKFGKEMELGFEYFTNKCHLLSYVKLNEGIFWAFKLGKNRIDLSSLRTVR